MPRLCRLTSRAVVAVTPYKTMGEIGKVSIRLLEKNISITRFRYAYPTEGMQKFRHWKETGLNVNY